MRDGPHKYSDPNCYARLQLMEEKDPLSAFLLLLLLVVVAPTVAWSTSTGCSVYVSQSVGHDAPDCGSKGSPCAFNSSKASPTPLLAPSFVCCPVQLPTAVSRAGRGSS